MRRLVMLAVVPALLLGGQAGANPIACFGTITASGDETGWECGIYDTEPGLVWVYIVHHRMGAAKGARFKSETPECFVASHLGDFMGSAVCSYTGDFDNGIEVHYADCEGTPVLVGSRLYETQGLTEQCCFYLTVGHPDAQYGMTEQLDCDDQWDPMGIGYAQINPNEYWCAYPVEQTTWGQVKALYGD